MADLIRNEKYIGKSYNFVGNTQTNLILETLGKIYIKLLNKMTSLDDFLNKYNKKSEDINSIVIIDTSITNIDNYPGDGVLVYDSKNLILYIAINGGYVTLVTANGSNIYVKKTGDTITGTLDFKLESDDTPAFKISNKSLIKNLNAEYLNGEKGESFLRENSPNPKILYTWEYINAPILLNGLKIGDTNLYYIDSIANAVLNSIKINLIVSNNYSQGLLGSGFNLIKYDSAGKSYLEVDKLMVRLKAIFSELEIRKLTYAGGNFVFSPAGAVCSSVEVTKNGDYKCFFNTNDSEESVDNEFAVNDLVRMQEFNINTGITENAKSRYFWRKCIEVGYNYIVLSSTDRDMSSDDRPQEGDSLVTFGNSNNVERQNVILISVYGEDAPAIKQYDLINDYTIEGKEKTIISPKLNKFMGSLIFTSGEDAETYIKAVEGNIELKVGKNEIIASINLSEEDGSVRIKGERIKITGETIFEDEVGNIFRIFGLDGKILTINNGVFSVDPQGALCSTSGTIGGVQIYENKLGTYEIIENSEGEKTILGGVELSKDYIRCIQGVDDSKTGYTEFSTGTILKPSMGLAQCARIVANADNAKITGLEVKVYGFQNGGTFLEPVGIEIDARKKYYTEGEEYVTPKAIKITNGDIYTLSGDIILEYGDLISKTHTKTGGLSLSGSFGAGSTCSISKNVSVIRISSNCNITGSDLPDGHICIVINTSDSELTISGAMYNTDSCKISKYSSKLLIKYGDYFYPMSDRT